jgi:hypothetical protein
LTKAFIICNLITNHSELLAYRQAFVAGGKLGREILLDGNGSLCSVTRLTGTGVWPGLAVKVAPRTNIANMATASIMAKAPPP